MDKDRPSRSFLIPFVGISRAVLDQVTRAYLAVYTVILGANPSLVSFLISSRNLISFGGQSTTGKVSDKYGRKLVLQGAFLLSAGVSLSIVFIKNVYWIIFVGLGLLFVLFTFYPPKLPLFKDGATGGYGIA